MFAEENDDNHGEALDDDVHVQIDVFAYESGDGKVGDDDVHKTFLADSLRRRCLSFALMTHSPPWVTLACDNSLADCHEQCFCKVNVENVSKVVLSSPSQIIQRSWLAPAFQKFFNLLYHFDNHDDHDDENDDDHDVDVDDAAGDAHQSSRLGLLPRCSA